MALTKIGKEGITGISNSADATAITISSGEVATFSQSPIGTGMDRLLSNTTTSPASSVDISNTYINSTYDTYLIVFRMTPSGDDVNLNIQFATDGSTFQTGNIYGIKSYRLGEDAGATGFDAGGAWTVNSNTIGNDTGESINGYFYLVGANNTAAVSGIPASLETLFCTLPVALAVFKTKLDTSFAVIAVGE